MESIEIKEGRAPWRNGYNWPTGDISEWRGAARELKNTLDMMNA
jgi:hypothetical protein